MISLLLVQVVQAAPPSSTLAGSTGTLSWELAADGADLRIEGRSPRWTVVHTARADLSPLHTERTDADGARYVIDYDAAGATVMGPSGTVRFDRPGLWDADSVDVRLGQRVAAGADAVRFEAIDVGGPKVYTFQATVTERTTCGARACTAVQLTLTGLLRLVGPTWTYWYGDDGQLLRFEGPAGTFAVGGAP